MSLVRGVIIPHDVIYGSGIQDVNSLGYALNYYVHFISPILSPVGNNSITYDQIPNASDATIVIEKGLDLSSLMKYSQKNNAIFFLMLSLGSMYLSKLNGVRNVLGVGSETGTPFDTDLLVCLVLLIFMSLPTTVTGNGRCIEVVQEIDNIQKLQDPKESLEYSLLKFCLEFLDYQESWGEQHAKTSTFLP
ncbi:hypothetical protein Cantr_05793 [Candida viswanathii]|uniref:Uncharacterized protein n=1 Tax=Candida viswanathii TaxID=5486 RepID=A0A367XS49_9ASCO|nr:hypothetical protein Cantr_05793 [Candida viswanathii]